MHTEAWQAVQQEIEKSRVISLRDHFAADAQRAERFTARAAGWTLDYSKNRITPQLKERLVALQEQERGWAADRENLLRELNTLRAQRGRWVIGVQELESQRDELEVLRRRRDVLVAEMEKYAAEVEHMRGLYQPAAEHDARIRPITQPWLVDFQTAPTLAISELDWLNGIVE